MSALLAATGIAAGYDGRPVIREVDCRVDQGEIVALIGHNGAGKTTLVKTLFGAVRASAGSLAWRDRPLRLASTAAAVQAGLRLVPEGVAVFADLSVIDNIAIGASAAGDGRIRPEALDFVYRLFPRLEERRRQLAGTLSGGERKMLGIAMALATAPALLLLDEPSLGLAPALVQELFATVARIRADTGLSILLVEQNVRRALEIADRVYVMKLGRIVAECRAGEVGSPVELMRWF